MSILETGRRFWEKLKRVKTARSVDVSRAITEQRARFNPMRNFTPDKLVRAIDNWRIGTLCDLARILEELEQRDEMILACSQKMKSSVARCKHAVKIVEGYENDPMAELQRKVLERFYANIRTSSVFCRNERGGFRLLVKQMMDAVHAKYAVHEIIWEPKPDGSLSARFQFVPLWMFENHTGELRFLDYYGAYDGVAMEPGEWLVTVGEGVGIAAAVAAMSKRLSVNDWLMFSERCGTPGLHVTTQAGKDTPEWEELVDAVRNFGKEWGAVTDENTRFNTVSLAQSGSIPYPELVRTMNKAISVLYRGADLSTLSGEGGDANGASLQGRESDILEQDACEMLSETLQEQVDKFVLRWHFGERVVPMAYIQIEPNAKQDAQLDMEIDKHLVELGVKLSKNDALQRYSRTEWKADAKDDAPLQPSQGAQGAGMPGEGAPPPVDGSGATLPPPGNAPALPPLANADGDAATAEAWKAMRKDLNGALEACRAAIEAKDGTAFINALAKIPKTADGQRLADTLKRQMKDALASGGKQA